MISDFKKSVDNILYERLTSPLFGAFSFSWCLWNWKIFYLTFFVESKVVGNKIEYIIKNYSQIENILLNPIFSTLFLILIYPLIATGAFWVSLKFENLKINLRNDLQKKQLLSIEQSISLREEVRNQDEKFDRLLTKKNEEISSLSNELNNYKNQLLSLNQNISELPTETKENIYKQEFELLQTNDLLFKEFEKIAPKALKELTMFSENNTINRKLFDYFLTNDIIENHRNGVYKLTSKGKYFNKILVNTKMFE